ncbi:MAG: uroporphyrinogen-III synthase [Gammaproteobacteria bacterium]|nr:uroporphyrinogen-III synthase [Gammaproteobacteria bacterium]MBU1624851.1 uroporphyrinogen-III synthase [Gammaproteobacteria bacterium]MBU1982695.1 uroporphyrinogen-III synthase [Gammaproteobacteria bacterium]
MTDRPLGRLNIVVTRPRDQASGLAASLRTLGANPVMLPLLEIAPAPDQAALQDFVQQAASYQLLIFISPNAVHYGMAALHRIPQGVRVAAVGQGTAKALRKLQVKPVIVPSERFDSEGLLALPELQRVEGWRIAILRGDGGRELLGETLASRGAQVEYVTCYQRSKPKLEADAWLAAQPDVITVTSSEALAHLWQGLGEAAVTLARSVTLFVAHPRIAQIAQSQGWQHVVITTAGDDGMCEGLVAWAAQHRK